MDGGSTQSHALHLVLGLVFGGGTDNLFRDLVFLSYMEVRVDGMDLGKQVWRKVERCSLLLRATAGQSSRARHAATRGTKIRVQRLSPWVFRGLGGGEAAVQSCFLQEAIEWRRFRRWEGAWGCGMKVNGPRLTQRDRDPVGDGDSCFVFRALRGEAAVQQSSLSPMCVAQSRSPGKPG